MIKLYGVFNPFSARELSLRCQNHLANINDKKMIVDINNQIKKLDNTVYINNIKRILSVSMVGLGYCALSMFSACAPALIARRIFGHSSKLSISLSFMVANLVAIPIMVATQKPTEQLWNKINYSFDKARISFLNQQYPLLDQVKILKNTNDEQYAQARTKWQNDIQTQGIIITTLFQINSPFTILPRDIQMEILKLSFPTFSEVLKNKIEL